MEDDSFAVLGENKVLPSSHPVVSRQFVLRVNPGSVGSPDKFKPTARKTSTGIALRHVEGVRAPA